MNDCRLSASASTAGEAGATAPPPRPLQEVVDLRWEDLCRADPSAGDLVRRCKRVRDSLARVWACSEFVAKSVIAQPALLQDLITTEALWRTYAPGTLTRRVREAIVALEDETQVAAELRRLRRREMVRIAWRRLAGWADLAELVGEVSELADASVSTALTSAMNATAAAFGRPLGEDGEPQPMVVLGLGKLGGRELNFSSDIDVMLAYPEDGETDGATPRSNHEYFRRVGQRLVRLLDDVTADGFVFRTDLRLRPNGDSGPLALSFAAMEHYYQTHGRDWERYALIKARVVAGDAARGAELLSTLRPFVYRKYLDFGAFEALRDMKRLIERELERKGVADDIKLGPGGIREIEFLAQSFQLIHGGRQPELRCNQLLPVLRQLAVAGIISAGDARKLGNAYRFLRDTEHSLQMIADQQVHRLPSDEVNRARVAYAMGYSDWEAFVADLDAVRASVERLFRSTLQTGAASDRGPPELKDLWQGVLDEGAATAVLASQGFEQPADTLRLLQHLRGGSNYRSFSSDGRSRLDTLMPLLIDAARATPSPSVTLARLLHVVESIGRRSAYLALLIENDTALRQLVRLCAASPGISNRVARHPVLLDELIDPISRFRAHPVKALRVELDRLLDTTDAADLESRMEGLREFRHGHALRVAAADVAGLLPAAAVNKELCGIAEASLHGAVRVAVEGLAPRIGVPRCGGDGDPHTPEFMIVAYGKLGSRELGYNSDLDIIFLHESCRTPGETVDGERSLSNDHYFGRLVQRLVHILTTRTRGGILYEIDTRLRPSGRSGPIVISLSAYAEYQKQQAWTWEHQALVRARMVVGSRSAARRFESVRRDVLSRERDVDSLKEQIRSMRERMIAANCRSDDRWFDLKLGHGGIVDIEFLVQYCVLRWGGEHPALLRRRDTAGLLGLAGELGMLAPEQSAELIAAWREFLQRDRELKLAEQPALIRQDDMLEARKIVKITWDKLIG